MRLISLFATALVTASVVMTGCTANETKTVTAQSAQTKPAEMASSITLFESHDDGRIHIFYDQKTFNEFKSVGETSYRLTRIGGGPNGETVVFGLPKKDAANGAQTPAAMLFDGKSAVTSFYGEMYKHGRIYVFDNKDDMDFVRKIGEPSYMFTAIGDGPKGETVVYVLNKNNNKKKPVKLIEQFKSMH